MNISSRTPEGWPNTCPTCGKSVVISPSTYPIYDAPCPHCGTLLLFEAEGAEVTSGLEMAPGDWLSDPPSWKSLLGSPMTLCSLAFHAMMILASIYSSESSVWMTWLLAACCLVFLPVGGVVIAIGWSSRRHYYHLQRAIEKGHFPNDPRLVSKNTHRCLLAVGVLLASPAAWLIPLLLRLGQ